MLYTFNAECLIRLYDTCVLECCILLLQCWVLDCLPLYTCACVCPPFSLSLCVWLQQRKALETDPSNRQVLHAIDSALVFIALENEPSGDLNALANKAFHGNGRNTWFDKAVSIVFYTNGRQTGNIEHSYLDATVSPVNMYVHTYCTFGHWKRKSCTSSAGSVRTVQ